MADFTEHTLPSGASMPARNHPGDPVQRPSAYPPAAGTMAAGSMGAAAMGGAGMGNPLGHVNPYAASQAPAPAAPAAPYAQQQPAQPTAAYGQPAAYGQQPGAPTQAQPAPQGWQVRNDPAPAPGRTAPTSASAPSAPPMTRASVSRAGAPRAAAASPQATATRPGATTATDLDIDELLRALVSMGASDLHLTSGAHPMLRRNGSLVPLESFPIIEGASLRRTLYSILKQRQRERFEEELELDFSYSVPNTARFRVNIYQQRESVGAAFRVIPFEIKPLEELGVPGVVANFAGLPRGLVLVTGPTGSGKSTTLASIIDLANRTRSDHIMTVEDPIEFLHDHKKSIINQREVGADTHSFANALKHVLRQDPDIILVGEMRDLETISVALTAAETGHLVFATLHTQDAAQTIDRIVDVFPPEQQGQVRTQLASSLQGVVCQTLCKRAGRPGRVVATEVLVATPAIRNLVREGKTHQIYSSMQAGQDHGMHTLDQHLADLVRTGQITYETGLEKAHHMEDYNKLTGRQARMNQGGAALQAAANNIGGM